MAPQTITDCVNFTLDFKQHGLCASPLFLQTLGPCFPKERLNLLSSENITLDYSAAVDSFFSSDASDAVGLTQELRQLNPMSWIRVCVVVLTTSLSRAEQVAMGNIFSTSQGPVKEVFQIISLGKAGTGKSHTGNTILGLPNVFRTKCSSVSVTEECDSKTASVNGRPITYIDTPGFFDTVSTEHSLRSEILRSIIKSSQGPHAFLIILKAETYTGQEMETVRKITESFGVDALNYAVVLFTHGDNLDEGQTIEDFVSRNQELQQLVDKCGGRCHVIDNRYWNHQKRGYRSNKVQVENLLNTIEDMIKRNGGGRYTNEMLQTVNREIQEMEDEINRESNGRLLEEQIRDEAENRVHTKFLVRLAGVATGVLLGAFLGIPTCIVFVLKNVGFDMVSAAAPLAKESCDVLTTACLVVGGAVLAGAAVVGGHTGYKAVEGEQTVGGAVKKAAHACRKKAENIVMQGTLCSDYTS